MAVTDRAAFRELAHQLLCRETGALRVIRLCPRCGSAGHGRPLVVPAVDPAPEVSLSYAGSLVALAWGWSGPVGIDIEVVGPPVDGLDRPAWTRQEALFKAGPGDHRVESIAVPAGYLGSVAGVDVSWLLAGPAAPDR